MVRPLVKFVTRYAGVCIVERVAIASQLMQVPACFMLIVMFMVSKEYLKLHLTKYMDSKNRKISEVSVDS